MTAYNPVDCDPRAAPELLRAIAHPMRLIILCRLLDGELAVSGFESEMNLKQPSLSQQLGLLRDAGLVTARREAKSVVYALANARVGGILHALRDYFTGARPVRIPPPPPLDRLPASQHDAPAQFIGATECGVFSVAGWPTEKERGDD